MYVFEVQALHVESPMMRKESFIPKKFPKQGAAFKTVLSEGTDFLNTPKKTGIPLFPPGSFTFPLYHQIPRVTIPTSALLT